jgi:hypothetical protein
MVSELERDLGTAATDLATADHQFSQVTNQLQVVSEGEPRGRFLSLSHSLLVSCHILIRWSSLQGCVCTAPG